MPPPPKSSSATTPVAGKPPVGRQRGQRRDCVSHQPGRHAVAGQVRLVRSALRNARKVGAPQCGHRDGQLGRWSLPRGSLIAERPTSRVSGWIGGSVRATRGTGSPTRSTNPPSVTPGESRTPTLRRPVRSTRSTPSADSQVDSPTRAATKLVVPIDNPNGSLITLPRIAVVGTGTRQTPRPGEGCSATVLWRRNHFATDT